MGSFFEKEDNVMTGLLPKKYGFCTTPISVRCSEKNTVEGKVIQEVLDDAKAPPGIELISWKITIPSPEDETYALIELNLKIPDWS